MGRSFDIAAHLPRPAATLHFEKTRNDIDSNARICHFEFYRKDDFMIIATLMRALRALLFTPPPAPCCASDIHWASFR